MNSPVRERTERSSTATGPVRGVGRAHAKAILLGEHTVVHGTPAIAFPLPTLSVRAIARPGAPGGVLEIPEGHFGFVAGNPNAAENTLSGPRVAVEEALRRWGLTGQIAEVVMECDIPLARGLGSSAACAGAAVRAVADLHGRTVDAATLYELVQCGEQVAHGRASGIDASAVLADGPIRFHEGTATALDIGLDAALVIADTGVPGSTQHAVAGVRRTLDHDPRAARRVLSRAGELISGAAADLSTGNAPSLGQVMLDFQDLLAELGVSTPHIDTLVAAALDAGAYGAKLTGAGLGGCVLALTETGDARTVSAALRRAGAVQTWTVPTRGLRSSAQPPSAPTSEHGVNP
ncbi:mevalonate kinase [Nocardia alba]|uniref:mevalonate kinase n=1 Tax=Nocardia alba TaxID=225051 RepID=A0A4R1FVL1_9NOCA|nr:mevalonate kinase [Nocardia alba]TCJ95351.1 mevalonate kinase [Nocardia alba]